jgi:hypothetical protein
VVVVVDDGCMSQETRERELSMYEVTILEPGEGVLTVICGDWLRELDENRPLVANGTVFEVRNGSGRRFYWEAVRVEYEG